MGYRRTFLVIIAAAIAVPAIASAQEQEHVFVTGAMQDREQRVTVLGAAQDREQRVTVLGSADDQRTVTGTNANRTLQTVPVVYEDEPAPAPAPTTTPAPAPAPAAQPHR